MIELSRIKKIHFVGIGGAGMSGIAEVLHNMGFTISGSDIADGSSLRRLRQLGIVIGIGHHRNNIRDAGALVHSSAIAAGNPELVAARRSKLPVISRAEMLAELMRMKFSIAVAGTHGKTTTTSMIATILNRANLDPTFVIGGKLMIEDSGAKLGSSRYLVAEADESDGSFLQLFPVIAVITNIENDHLEHYGKMDKLVQAFTSFANKVPFYGTVVLGSDCPACRRMAAVINRKVITFGYRAKADVRAERIRSSAFASSFDLVFQQRRLGGIELTVGGKHNIANALAAVAAALEIGIDFDTIHRSLRSFELPERRFQVLFRNKANMVVDDYAHHPTEIMATLKMARQSPYRRIIAVFQPHRYTRLKILMDEFATSFRLADQVLIAPLYSANQQAIKNVDGARLARRIKRQTGQEARYLDSFPAIKEYLHDTVDDGDAVIFLSAGNLTQLAHDFAAAMSLRKT